MFSVKYGVMTSIALQIAALKLVPPEGDVRNDDGERNGETWKCGGREAI